MSLREGIITRLIARVRALLPGDWRGRAGQRFRKTVTTISDFADEHHVRPGEVLGEGVELGRRKLEGLANHEFSQAVKNFADTEKIKIESELQRRSLESDVAKKEAEARKASAEARIQEAKAIEAELELVDKLRRAGVLLCKDPTGNLAVLPAPTKVDFSILQQRVIEAHVGTPNVVCISEVVQNAVAAVNDPSFNIIDIASWTALPAVYGDPSVINDAIVEILQNARSYASEPGVLIEGHADRTSVRITVRNKTDRMVGDPLRLGQRGQGLRLVSEAVAAIGGQIAACADQDRWFIVELTFPRAEP
jgi:signal transduction histidine kinase